MLLSLAVLLLLCTPAFSANIGGIQVFIRDDMGTPIEGVKFTMVHKDYGTKQTMTTDKNGKFEKMALAVGIYTVTIEKEGFETLTTDLRVRLGRPKEQTEITLPRLQPQQQEQEMTFKLGDTVISPEVKDKYEKGLDAYKSSRNDEAIKLFEEAAAAMPTLPEPHFYLYELYKKAGNRDKAIGELKNGLELKPNWPQAQLKYAYEMEEAGQDPDAEAAYRKAIEEDPNLADAHKGLGMMLVKKAQYQESKQHLDKYLELNPSASDAPTIRGITKELEKLLTKSCK
jgi:tetratricopeptide (TPR) repeat protein